MDRGAEIKLLSKHRGAIMGVAIIMILLCHSTLTFDGVSGIVYDSARRFLQIGVDIFLFVSGLGCCFSLNKNSKLFGFYFKRGVKILVPYCLVLAIWALVQPLIHIETGIVGFVYKYSLVTFFLRGELSSWYVAAILVLYMAAPFNYMVLKRSKKLFCVMTGASLLVAVGLTLILGNLGDGEIVRIAKVIVDVFVVRVPVFCVGMLLGDEIYNGKEISVSYKAAALIFALFIALFALNDIVFPGEKWVFGQWFINRFLYQFGAVCIALFLGCFFERISRCRIYSFFVGAGAVTFELYLIHEKVLMFTDEYIAKLFSTELAGSIASNACAIAIAVVAALLIHKLAQKLSSKIQSMIKRKQ